VLETKQAGLLRRIIQRDTLVVERLEFDRALLTRLLPSRGYPDFRVVDVTTEFARERNATFITIAVEEGQRFQFGEITARSTIAGVDAATFLPEARIRRGTTFTPTAIENAIARMERRALSEGWTSCGWSRA
jgi:outer membrane protein insertion porin family